MKKTKTKAEHTKAERERERERERIILKGQWGGGKQMTKYIYNMNNHLFDHI